MSLNLPHIFGDPATHLVKTGGVIRDPDGLTPLQPIVDYLGDWHRGVPVEYDISYLGDDRRIRGYAYNEIMRGIQAHPMGPRWIRQHIAAIACWPDTSDALAREVLARNGDKYVMERPQDLSHLRGVAFLPGTNKLGDLDHDRLATLVDAGWCIKPHPLTHPRSLAALRYRYGPARVLGKRVSGWDVYRASTEVATTHNTEFGLIALLEGKPWRDLEHDARNILPTSYCRFFELALMADGMGVTPRSLLLRALNCPFSGLVFPWQPDWRARLDSFFDFFAGAPHGRNE